MWAFLWDVDSGRLTGQLQTSSPMWKDESSSWTQISVQSTNITLLSEISIWKNKNKWKRKKKRYDDENI